MIKNRINNLMDQLVGACVFTNIDVRSYYHQIHMKFEDILKTTFRTRYGHYEYMVMSFSVTNVPVVFMEYMNMIVHPYLDSFIFMFINDILKEHVKHLRVVLQVLKDKQQYVKMSKCDLWPNESFLSHIISYGGIVIDPFKIKVMVKWEVPKSISKIKSFLGLIGYNKRFIEGFFKYLKDFDFGLSYYPNKANEVVDAFSSKSLHISTLTIREVRLGMLRIINRRLDELGKVEVIPQGKRNDRRNLSVHLSATKMNQNLKKMFWCFSMKKKVAEFVYGCLVSQKAKIEHKKLSGLERLTSLYISEIIILHGAPSSIKFNYNNSYHSNIGMAPYNPFMAKGIGLICVGLSQSRQKSYLNKIRKDLKFKEGDQVFLIVTAWTVVGRALKSCNLYPCFIGLCQILKRIGEVAYQITLPLLLEICMMSLTSLDFKNMFLIFPYNIQVKDNLSYKGWTSNDNTTYELEDHMRVSYLEMFTSSKFSGTKILIKRGSCNTSIFILFVKYFL
ncbi:Retrovirus-related Pol polyprotein, partial [Mucuna pruriens]